MAFVTGLDPANDGGKCLRTWAGPAMTASVRWRLPQNFIPPVSPHLSRWACVNIRPVSARHGIHISPGLDPGSGNGNVPGEVLPAWRGRHCLAPMGRDNRVKAAEQRLKPNN